jgi:hypothetical protein
MSKRISALATAPLSDQAFKPSKSQLNKKTNNLFSMKTCLSVQNIGNPGSLD